MGGTYGSSTFIGLTALIEGSSDLNPGDRVSMFSYGSGSCAEFYCGLIGPDAKELVKKVDLGRKLDARYQLSVREYEDVERERTCYIDHGDFAPSTDGFSDWYARRYKGQGLLVFQGIREHYRCYGWS
jgi:3-hydroxy-3-methylglutaryl CoA synthase